MADLSTAFVLEFTSDGELFTATGNVSDLYNGERVTFIGRWTVHPTFGKQFKIEMCQREMPQTAADMLSYLSSGIVKGVKEKTAQKIVERFGEDSFYIIENYPERLAEIKGISKERAREISALPSPFIKVKVYSFLLRNSSMRDLQ